MDEQTDMAECEPGLKGAASGNTRGLAQTFLVAIDISWSYVRYGHKDKQSIVQLV